MLTECFEMESRHSASSHLGQESPPYNRLVKKVVAEEYELRDLPTGTAISCWWMTLPVFYYLAVIAGGVIASISVGDVTAAFDNQCVFYANLTLKGLDHLNNTKVLGSGNVEVTTWGDMDTCMFPEYTSVACVMYAGVLLVMVLQCGRGGGKSAFRGRGIAESWRIVPIAFVFNLIFLILSSIIFGNIQNGFSTFCDGISQIDSSKSLGNYSRCADVLQYTFPWDKYNTNLYTEYLLAKLGATLQLVGSLLAFLTIIIRCCLPADFVVYRRRQFTMAPGIQSSYDEENVNETFGSTSQLDRQRQPHPHDTGETSTTVECHNQSVADPDQSFLPAEGANYDAESMTSAGSDTNLVHEASASGSSSKIRIVKGSSKA